MPSKIPCPPALTPNVKIRSWLAHLHAKAVYQPFYGDLQLPVVLMVHWDYTFFPPSVNSMQNCSIYMAWNQCPVDQKSSMNEKIGQKYLEQESISLAKNESRVNLGNLYNLTRGDGEYHLPSRRTNVVQKHKA